MSQINDRFLESYKQLDKLCMEVKKVTGEKPITQKMFKAI